MILATSKMIHLQASDMKDQRTLETGEIQPRYRTGSAFKAIKEVVEICSINYSLKKGDIDLQLEEIKDYDMKFDSQRFQQVLLNILSNAIKFSDFTKNQQITVRGIIAVHKEEI